MFLLSCKINLSDLSVQRPIPALNENTFIEPLTTSYVLPPSQNLTHVVYPKSTMEPVHCSHYIVGPGPIDYTPAPPAANLGMWDTPQMPSKLTTATNDIAGSGKKVRTEVLSIPFTPLGFGRSFRLDFSGILQKVSPSFLIVTIFEINVSYRRPN